MKNILIILLLLGIPSFGFSQINNPTGGGGNGSGISRECVFPSGGGTCVVTHNLSTTSPVIGQTIVNSGCANCFTIGSFTSNTFTVTSTQASDLVFPIAYASSNIPSFSVSVAPIHAVAVQGGTSATYTITGNPGLSYSGTITPTCTSFVTIGSGLSCGFSPVTLTSGGSWTSTLTITASGSATLGSGTFVISGTDGLTTQVSTANALTVSSGVTLDTHLTTEDCYSLSSQTSCTTTTPISMTAGDVILVHVGGCADNSCSNPCPSSGASVTMTDTGNADTFSYLTGANASGSGHCWYTMYAPNLVGGSRNLTINIPAGFFYMDLWIETLSGANAVSPIDSSVTNATNAASGTSFSLSSAGNVSSSGEVILAPLYPGSSGSPVLSGAFSFLPATTLGILNNPSAGSGVTFSGTQSSTAYNIQMIGVKP